MNADYPVRCWRSICFPVLLRRIDCTAATRQLARRCWLLLVLTCLVCGGEFVLAGPIAYLRPALDSNPPELWRINPDLSGNERITSELLDPAQPKWSTDGRLLSLVATDPARPNQVSDNVFGLDPINGQMFQYTSHTDSVVFNPPGPPVSSYSTPWYKAFSPNNAFVAVSRVRTLVTISSWPILEIYDTQTGDLVRTLNTGAEFQGDNLPGAGVDWSPVEDRIVHPVNFSHIVPSGLAVNTTSLVYFSPEGGDPVEQLTFPSAEEQQIGFDIIHKWENDYAPAFSPDGTQIAYFRALEQRINSFDRSPSEVQLRIINSDGTGDHPILWFDPGWFPQQVTWSPDATQLLFDLGQQDLENNRFTTIPSTTELFWVTADGADFGQFLPAPASFASWSPAPESSILLGDADLDGVVNGLDVDPFVSLVTSGTYQDEGDMNGDGEVNGLDVDPFVEAVVGGSVAAVPEPSALFLTLAALGILGAWRRER